MAGQGGAALLGLALIKLGASGFPVVAYGTTALLLGLQALVRNTTLNPLLNLAIYTFREEGAQFGHWRVHHATTQALTRLLLGAFPLFLIAIWALRVPVDHRTLAAAWLLIILATEAFKTARLNLLHSDGRAKRYALWILVDSALKPVVLIAYLNSGGPRTTQTLLACHTLASILSLGLTAFDPVLRALVGQRDSTKDEAPGPLNWLWTHRVFLLPLVGVGLTGWLTGLSDRYLVNLFLGAESAGLYAGVYALFSAPFLILGTAFTLAIRPRLLNLHAERNFLKRDSTLWQGLGVLGAIGLGLALLLYALREPLVSTILRPAYLLALPAAPGILLGNAILILGTGMEQMFYVTRRTRLVLAKQTVGSIFALLIVGWATPHLGIAGAGWACPIYATIEIGASIILLRYSGIIQETND